MRAVPSSLAPFASFKFGRAPGSQEQAVRLWFRGAGNDNNNATFEIPWQTHRKAWYCSAHSPPAVRLCVLSTQTRLKHHHQPKREGPFKRLAQNWQTQIGGAVQKATGFGEQGAQGSLEQISFQLLAALFGGRVVAARICCSKKFGCSS